MAVVYDPDSIYVKAFKLFLSEDEDSLEKLKNLNNSLLQKKLPLRDGFRFEKTETQPADNLEDEIPALVGSELEEDLPKPPSTKKPKASLESEAKPEVITLDDSLNEVEKEPVDNRDRKQKPADSSTGGSGPPPTQNIFATMSKKEKVKPDKEERIKKEKSKVPKEERERTGSSNGKSESLKSTDGVPAKKMKITSKGDSVKDVKELDSNDKAVVKCSVCSEGLAVSKNELVECVNCSKVFHQECHIPPILDNEALDPRLKWSCKICSATSNTHPIRVSQSSQSSEASSNQSSSTSASGSKVKSKNKDKEHKSSLGKSSELEHKTTSSSSTVSTSSSSSSKSQSSAIKSIADGMSSIGNSKNVGSGSAPSTPTPTLGGGGLFSNLAAAWGNLHSSSTKSSPGSSSKMPNKTGQIKDDSLGNKHTAGSTFLAGLARQASVPDRPVNRSSPDLSSSSSTSSKPSTLSSSSSPSKNSSIISGESASASLKSLQKFEKPSSGSVKFAVADDIFGKPGSSLSKTAASTSKKISSSSLSSSSALPDSSHSKSSSSSVTSSSSSLIGSTNNSSSSSKSMSASPNEAAMKRLKMMEKKASAKRNNQIF